MDGNDLEPANRLHQGQPGLQALLRRADGAAAAGYGSTRYDNGFEPTLHDDLLDLPLTWKRPRTIFVNSMSDLFHADVPLDFIQRVFETMQACPQHTFQMLTKRSERLPNLLRHAWPATSGWVRAWRTLRFQPIHHLRHQRRFASSLGAPDRAARR